MSPELCLPGSRHGYLLSSGLDLGLHFTSLLSPRNSTRSQQTDCGRLFQALMLWWVLFSLPKHSSPTHRLHLPVLPHAWGEHRFHPLQKALLDYPPQAISYSEGPGPPLGQARALITAHLRFLAYWPVFPH